MKNLVILFSLLFAFSVSFASNDAHKDDVKIVKSYDLSVDHAIVVKMDFAKKINDVAFMEPTIEIKKESGIATINETVVDVVSVSVIFGSSGGTPG